MKCVCCSAEFTIKTDLENMDYVCEHGVSRNFEVLQSTTLTLVRAHTRTSHPLLTQGRALIFAMAKFGRGTKHFNPK